MKKLFKSFLSLILIFSIFLPVYAEVLIQPAPTAVPITDIKPISSHPRLLVTSEDVAVIRENLTKQQNLKAYNEYLSKAESVTTGMLDAQAASYNYDSEILGTIEAKAFKCLLNIDINEEVAAAAAYEAVTGITNFVNTLNYDGSNYHAASHVVFIAAEVYDWCHKYLTTEQKDALIEGVQNGLLKKLTYGYPFTNLQTASALGGNTTFHLIIKDALGFSIAIYDEYPDMYNYVASVVLDKYIDVRNYWYDSLKNPSGTSYGIIRHYADMWLNSMFYKATGVKLLDDDVYKTAYQYLYMFTPDGYLYKEADDHWISSNVVASDYHNKTIYADLIIASSALSDGYLKTRALEMEKHREQYTPSASDPYIHVPWNYDHVQFTPVQYLIFNNPDVKAKDLSELSNAYYMGEPDGMILAKTGWGENEASAFMKIGGQFLYQHNHFDFGTFQLSYKGRQMVDLGIYTGTDKAEYDNFNVATISHNGLLIYDPDEFVRSYINGTYGAVNSGGQQIVKFSQGPTGVHTELSEYDIDFFDRADVLNYSIDDNYSYISGDITKAYSDKAELVKRSMMFKDTGIEDAPAVFFVMDKLTSSDKAFKKSFLFQCLVEPEVNGNAITIRRKKIDGKLGGELTNQVLYPKNYEMNVVGGVGSQWLVNGINYYPQTFNNILTRLDMGWGRIYISPEEQNETDYFLNVMYMNDIGKYEKVQTAELIENDIFLGGKVLNAVTLFNKNNTPVESSAEFNFEGQDEYNISVTGLSEGIWKIEKDGAVVAENITVTKDASVIDFKSTGGNFVLTQLESHKVVSEENSLFGGGYGTKEEPYKIYTAEQFLNISSYPEAHYILMDDIELSSHAPFEFNGVFNGNNKTITIDCFEETTDYIGIFSKLTRNSEIHNLNIKGYVSGRNYVGGLAGTSEGRIINVKNYASVYAATSYAGGICGRYLSYYDRIKGCSNYGPVSAATSNAGGICGENSGVIIYSNNYGIISAGTNAGGISGIASQYIYKSFNAGKIDAVSNAGGITGNILYKKYFTFFDCNACYNLGEVTADNENTAGGIVGYDTAEAGKVNISECYTLTDSVMGGSNPVIATPVFDSCYYISDKEIDDYDGTSALTLEELSSAEGLNEEKWIITDNNLPQLIGNIYEEQTGTYDNPIEISSSEEFAAISSAPNAHYILTDDISTEDISTLEYFGGSLNGNGKTIKVIQGTKSIYSRLLRTAEIKNLSIDGNFKVSGSKAGVLTSLSYGKIINCKNYADVNLSGSYNGIFAGQNLGGIISDCTNHADVVLNSSNSGVICGYSTGKITNCGNYNNVTLATGLNVAGGIVGGYQTTKPLENCFNFGDLISKTNMKPNNIGGIAGNLLSKNAKLYNCFNSGNITAAKDKIAGGICGAVTSATYTGVKFENCYNSGSVIIGGIDTTNENSIYNSTSANDTKIISCYYLGTAEGKEGSLPLSEDEMKDKKSFEAWDFINVWYIDTGDYKYPQIIGNYDIPASPVAYYPSLNELSVFDTEVSDNFRLKLMNRDVLIAFSKYYAGNKEYKLSDYGFVISRTNAQAEINSSDTLTQSVYNGANNAFGTILYGSYITEGEYYLRPYVKYLDSGNSEITVYGSPEKINTTYMKGN